MRQLQLNISSTGNEFVRQGKQLIVRVEVLRSLCANSISALRSHALWLLKPVHNALVWDAFVWQSPIMAWLLPATQLVPATQLAHSFAIGMVPAMTSMQNATSMTSMQNERRHAKPCHRTAALNQSV